MEIKMKFLKYIIIFIVSVFILFSFIKPLVTTGYCVIYTPDNPEISSTYFGECLYNSYLSGDSKYFLNLLDRIKDENKHFQLKDFLYMENFRQGNIEKANNYLKRWKEIDYRNGTFEYFQVEQTNIDSPEKENEVYQNLLLDYKKYSTNKDISPIIKLYKNWLSLEENIKFRNEGLTFIEKLNNQK